MTPERRAVIERDARALLRVFSTSEIQAIELGLFGARDAQLAAAVAAGCEHAAIIQRLEDQIAELQSDLKEFQDADGEETAMLRRLLVEACEIIEANCTGFSNRVEEILAEGDV